MSEPKERPIIFSGEMVRAILDDRKTQTRRVITQSERVNEWPWEWNQAVQLSDGTWSFWYPGGDSIPEFAQKAYPEGGGIKCPYGRPGDLLYVRECWSGPWGLRNIKPSERPENSPIYYWADGRIPPWGDWEKPRPSIHMPKWAARIWLEVTGIRVERVQDTSAMDVLAEGVGGDYAYDTREEYGDQWHPSLYRNAFGRLWDSINAKRGYGWDENPWVWVVEFQQVDAP